MVENQPPFPAAPNPFARTLKKKTHTTERETVWLVAPQVESGSGPRRSSRGDLVWATGKRGSEAGCSESLGDPAGVAYVALLTLCEGQVAKGSE